MELSVPFLRRPILTLIATVSLAATALQASIMAPVVPVPFALASLTSSHQSAPVETASVDQAKNQLVRGEMPAETDAFPHPIITKDTASWGRDLRMLSYQDSENMLTQFTVDTPAIPFDSGLTIPAALPNSIPARGLTNEVTLFTIGLAY